MTPEELILHDTDKIIECAKRFGIKPEEVTIEHIQNSSVHRAGYMELVLFDSNDFFADDRSTEPLKWEMKMVNFKDGTIKDL